MGLALEFWLDIGEKFSHRIWLEFTPKVENWVLITVTEMAARWTHRFGSGTPLKLDPPPPTLPIAFGVLAPLVLSGGVHRCNAV